MLLEVEDDILSQFKKLFSPEVIEQNIKDHQKDKDSFGGGAGGVWPEGHWFVDLRFKI